MKPMFKFLLGVVVIINLAGCGTVTNSTLVPVMVNDAHALVKSGDGVLYGSVNGADSNEEENQKQITEICALLPYTDSRCDDKKKYRLYGITGRFGFRDGWQGTIVLVPKSAGTIKAGPTGCNDCTYLKVKLTPGRLADFVEVADKGGEGKCHWVGGARTGGTVCPAHGWDYRNEMTMEDITTRPTRRGRLSPL